MYARATLAHRDAGKGARSPCAVLECGFIDFRELIATTWGRRGAVTTEFQIRSSRGSALKYLFSAGGRFQTTERDEVHH